MQMKPTQLAASFEPYSLFVVDLQALNVSLRRGLWDSRYTDITVRVQPAGLLGSDLIRTLLCATSDVMKQAGAAFVYPQVV